MDATKFRALAISCFFIAHLQLCQSDLSAQYVVSPNPPVNFGGLPGDANNTIFSGLPYSGPTTFFSSLKYKGTLTPDGTFRTNLLNYNLRINDSFDINFCCSATIDRGQSLDFPRVVEPDDPEFVERPGFFFFENGDQFSHEAWTTDEPDPDDPGRGPIQARFDSFEMRYENSVDPISFDDLGTFSPGAFNFRTVPTVDPEDPNASNIDIFTRLAIYSAADFSLVAEDAMELLTKYQEVGAALSPGDYYLAVGRSETFFDSRAVFTNPSFSFEAEGPVFNLELNEESLITDELEFIDNTLSRPKLFTFSVAEDLAGDFNRDGEVDSADFLVWQRGDSPDPLSSSDLAEWQMNYGQSAGSPGGLATVPEPSSLLLFLVGSIALRAVSGVNRKTCYVTY